MFDLVILAASVHGALGWSGTGCIFAENEAMRWLASFTGIRKGAFGVFTPGGNSATILANVTVRAKCREDD